MSSERVSAAHEFRHDRLSDRRQTRLTVPPCEQCESASTQVATRTEYVLYVRCQACGFVWSVPKPGQGQLGS